MIAADSLTGVVTSPGYADLLEAPQPVAEVAARVAALPHDPVFALMAAFDVPLGAGVPFDGVCIPSGDKTSPSSRKGDVSRGASAFQWIARNSSKPGRGSGIEGKECWVAITTARKAREMLQRMPLHDAQGKYNPQSAAYRDDVAEELFADFTLALQGAMHASGGTDTHAALRQGGIGQPSYIHAQRWGRAFITEPLEVECAAVPEFAFAACGDFCGGGGSGGRDGKRTPVEAAWLSGVAAAEAVAAWVGCTPAKL